jgi:acyl-CoA dehydrogenase
VRNPWTTPERLALRESAAGFVRRHVVPGLAEWEEAGEIPRSLHRAAAAAGLLGIGIPVEVGGQGGDLVDVVTSMEAMVEAGASSGLLAALFTHAIALPHIVASGNADLIDRFVRPTLAGELIGSLGVTEPDAGSDVAGIKTFAKRVDGGYVVNGSKMFITNGVRADFIVTAVKTTQEGGHQGLSFLIVDRGEGVHSSAIEKLGWHASDTALITFDDVFVPEENLLGEENQGFYLIMANFQWERLLMALGSVGGMQVCFDRTLAYARERQAFGKPIGSHQAIRHKFAEMATTIEAGRCVTYHALRLFVDGIDAVREVTMAKLATQRAAFDVADTCLQIHGGAGYMKEYGIERAARDSRLGPIGGGTDEIMREILGKSLGL